MITNPLRHAMLFVSLTLMHATASAQNPNASSGPPVDYELRFPNAVHHEARITATFRNIGRKPLQIRMSRSSPGRYALHEFAKNVYSVIARNSAGRPLQVSRTDPYSWIVSGHDGTVSVTYTLYADRADGTYAQIDATHAHLNMPATMMWASGYEQRPIRIRFTPFDPSWKVATQLVPGPDPYSFTAPNLQYLMDSPAELSAFDLRQWQVVDGNRSYTVRIALHHQGSGADADRLAEKVKRVVQQEIAVYGDVPDYDHGSYTFIADALPYASGDGMEHRNSTVITGSKSLAEANFAQLGTFSHEFFHSWNVERLRPRDLEPFDYTRANPTPLLWFSEGFTHYYGPLLIRRAGESSLDEFLQNLGGMLASVLNAPARGYGSPQEMSIRAPFLDAASSTGPTWIDPATENITISYYPYGAVVALALDLTLRQRGLTLDQYMRRMWRTNGARERAFTTDDLQRGLADLTGDSQFAAGFFNASIRGSALPEFAPLLAQAGLLLRPKAPKRPYVGATKVDVTDDKVMLARQTTPGSPLYVAGLDRGDQILSLGDRKISREADWTSALEHYSPGDRTEIHFLQRGRERKADISFIADPTLEIVRNEVAGLPLTVAQRAFRNAWLGGETNP